MGGGKYAQLGRLDPVFVRTVVARVFELGDGGRAELTEAHLIEHVDELWTWEAVGSAVNRGSGRGGDEADRWIFDGRLE